MTTVYIVGLLLITVVAANIIHLLWPVLPLAIYQILAGIMLSILPIDTHAIVLEPEIFMLLIIAPLMFNDGQNVSFRQLSQNIRQILSMAVGLAVVTVILVGSGVKLALPQLLDFRGQVGGIVGLQPPLRLGVLRCRLRDLVLQLPASARVLVRQLAHGLGQRRALIGQRLQRVAAPAHPAR